MVPWDDALAFVSGINDGTFSSCSAGHTDWRLPNIHELRSLVDSTVTGPAFPSGHPFVNLHHTGYLWSSTSAAGGVHAVALQTFYGTLGTDNKSTRERAFVPVRGSTTLLPSTGQTVCYYDGSPGTCAGDGQDGELRRGVAWPSPRFVDHADGTVEDTLTGLVWLANLNCIAAHYPDVDVEGTPGDGFVSFRTALAFAASVNAGDYPACAADRAGWRVPNLRELESLFTFYDEGNDSALAALGFTNLLDASYWSSTTTAGLPTDAMTLHPRFSMGRSAKTAHYLVMLVQ